MSQEANIAAAGFATAAWPNQPHNFALRQFKWYLVKGDFVAKTLGELLGVNYKGWYNSSLV